MANDDAKFLASGMEFVLNARNDRDAIDQLVKAAAACVGSDMGSFYILDEERKSLLPYVTHNFPPEYAAACARVPIGAQCCGRAVLHKIPWVIVDMWSDPAFEDASEGARKAEIRSGFSVPVLDANGNCLGSLGAQFKRLYSPTPYDLERQSLFAKLISFALMRYRGTAKGA
jgi:GAF domain-containing protein